MGYKAVLAIDIGGSKIMTGVVSENAEIYAKNTAELSYPITKAGLLKVIVELCGKTLAEYKGDNVAAVGAAIPGLADPANGRWVYASFSGISDFPIAKLLKEQLKLPVFIDNDVNACAIGEMHFGACANVKDFLWLTISNGIGGCVIADGNVLKGANGFTGEIGHINVADEGFLCQCGNRGCLEAEAAGPAIKRRYQVISGESDDTINAETIAEKARQGEKYAIEVYKQTGTYLGSAIASAVNLLNSEKVIIGGGVSAAMDLFYPSLMETLDKKVFKAANQNLLAEKTALGYDAALYGAAALGFRGIAQ